MPAPNPYSDDDWILPFDTIDLRKRSVNGAAITIISQIVRTLITSISLIWLARLLLPSDFGLLAIVAPVTGFLSLLSNIGLFQAIVQTPKISNTQVTSMFWISILLGLAVAFVFITLSPLIAWIYGEQRVISVMIAMSITIVCSSVSTLQIAILNRTMAFADIALIETSALFTSTATAVMLATAGWGYWALVTGQIVNALLTALFTSALTPWWPTSLRLSLSQTKGILAFGRNLSITNIAFYLNTSLDNVIVGLVLGIDLLGVYDRAWKLAVIPLGQLMSPVGRVALPALSRLMGDEARYRKYFKFMLQLLLLFTGPSLIAAICTAQVTVPGLLGSRWHDMAPVFQWLCLGGIITPINGALSWLFISQGRSRDQLIYSILAIAVNVASYAIGIIWGLEGVVRTGALSVYLIQTPILILGACKLGAVNAKYLANCISSPALSTIICGFMSYAAWKILLPNSMSGVVGLFGLAYLCYIFCVLATSDGRQMLQKMWVTLRQEMLERFLAPRARM